MNAWAQTWLVLTGIWAISLLQFDNPKTRLWGNVIGLAGQPVWLWQLGHNPQQWGMLVMAISFTLIYIAGIIGYHVKK